MSRLIPASAAAILFLSVICINCFALQPPISNKDLILKSQDIFHGIVKELRYEGEYYTMIYTYVTLEVLEVFKGEHRNKIIVRISGGTAGDEDAKEQSSALDSTSENLSNLPGVHRDSSGAFHFRGDGRITLVVEDEAELEEGMEAIIHTYMMEDGNLVIYGGARGVYEIKDGIIDHMDMTIDQYRDFVGEVIKQQKEEKANIIE